MSSPKRPSTSPGKVTKTVTRNGNTVTTTTTTSKKTLRQTSSLQEGGFTQTMLDQREYGQLQLALKEREIELEHKLNTLIALNEKLQVFNDLQKDVAENQQFVRDSEAAREQLQEQIREIAEQVKQDNEMKDEYETELRNQIEKLQAQIQELLRQASATKQQHIQETKNQDQRHATEMQRQQTKHTQERSQQDTDHANEMQRQLLQFTNERKQKDQQFAQEMGSLKLKLSEQMARERSQHETEMEQQRSEYELRIDELIRSVQKCEQQIVRMQGDNTELNARLTAKHDVELQRDTWKAHHDSMEMSKQELQNQLESASAYISQLEEKFYESQTTQLEMLKQMKEYEAELEGAANEIEQLRQYIIDLKSRIAVYIPVKNDTIDKKLAEYINNYPDRQKLKIMFMRESEGVYQFGTKRVMVKCVKDKIEIRVGGGFLSIDEFLDQYTPTELQVLERKDPMRRMTDRIALQKTLQGRETDSPTRSPTRGSPTRGSPMRQGGARKKQAV